MEASNEMALNKGNLGNLQSLMQRENQASNMLGQFSQRESYAAQQLAQLDNMLSELENQLQ